MSAVFSRPDADPPGTPSEAWSTPHLGPAESHLESPFPNRQYVSTDCLKRLDAFRYRPRGLDSAAASGTEARDEAGHTVNNAPADLEVRDWSGGDSDQEYESAQGEEDEEEDCLLTDYGSTSMFDDEPWFPGDEDDHTQSEAVGWSTLGESSGPPVDGVHELELDLGLSFVTQQGLADLVHLPASTQVNPDVGGQQGNKVKPLAQCSEDAPSDLTSPIRGNTCASAGRTYVNPEADKQCPPGFERKKKVQPLVPRFEEGSPDEVYPILGSILEASNGRQPAVTDVEGGRPHVVRCRASDVSRNGKVRSINVTRFSRGPSYNPGWPLSGKTMEPIQRPEFPAVVKQRPLIYGLSGGLTVKTCFRIEEALQVGSLGVGGNLQGDVLIELYGKCRVCENQRQPSAGTLPP